MSSEPRKTVKTDAGGYDEAWICEAHPWLDWPHHDCAGPGMPREVLGTLHEHAQLISDANYYAFRALLFACREGRPINNAVRALENYVPMRDGRGAGAARWPRSGKG